MAEAADDRYAQIQIDIRQRVQLPAGGGISLGAASAANGPRPGEEVPAERAHQRGGLRLSLLQLRDVRRQRVLLGVNRGNNSLCIVDFFNTKVHKNANLVLLGTSGAGKTFTMQLLALRMRMRGIQSFIVAPIKGHEFRRACVHIGGEFIKIAPGSPTASTSWKSVR